MGASQQLLDAATSATGFNNFGDDSFREGLEILLRSLKEEAQLNAVGEQILYGRIATHLRQRLEIENWYQRHPEIDDVQIKAPLIGIGLPRTGSTALSFLLAEDPHARSLTRWESAQPTPPPSTVPGPDPRLVAAQAVDRQNTTKSAHLPVSATGPSECQELMALDFKSYIFQAFAYIPSYSQWLINADMKPTYWYERRVLKLLQWGCPDRPWRLKNPNHLAHLDAIDEIFPDARFVMTHRDPTAVMTSTAHLYHDYISKCTEQNNPHYVGEMLVSQLSVSMNRALEFRNNGNEHRFYDIDFRAMQRDPVGEVRSLYDWLGEPISPAFETGMTQWWQENAKNREPNVHPDPAFYGLDLDKIRPLFADYTSSIAAWTK